MKYLLLFCWDAERMNGQTEPDPSAIPDEEEEGFPWVDDFEARGIWLTRRPAGSAAPSSVGPRPRREEDGD